MKIKGPDRTGPAAAAPRGGSPAAPGFSLPASEESAETASAGQSLTVGAVSSVDALIALQEVEGPLERRRRAVRRAGRLLDVLDEMKLALLEGAPDPVAARRLAAMVREERQQVDDPGLAGVLDEVETRARVELAKLEMAGRAA